MGGNIRQKEQKASNDNSEHVEGSPHFSASTRLLIQIPKRSLSLVELRLPFGISMMKQDVCSSVTLLMAANLIALLTEYGKSIPGFLERVGGDFARGHKEATGGIILKVGRRPA
jgi:hypothetical protein